MGSNQFLDWKEKHVEVENAIPMVYVTREGRFHIHDPIDE